MPFAAMRGIFVARNGAKTALQANERAKMPGTAFHAYGYAGADVFFGCVEVLSTPLFLSFFSTFRHRYSMNQETYVANLLQRRIRRHDLNPTQEQFDQLFSDFLELWQQAEIEAVNRRVSRLRLLDGLDAFLLDQVAKRNDK
jgi:hypothetical protein